MVPRICLNYFGRVRDSYWLLFSRDKSFFWSHLLSVLPTFHRSDSYYGPIFSVRPVVCHNLEFFNKNGREKEAREIEITLTNQITLKRCRCFGEMWLARRDLKNKTLKFKVDYYKMEGTTDGYWTWTWFWIIKLWFFEIIFN